MAEFAGPRRVDVAVVAGGAVFCASRDCCVAGVNKVLVLEVGDDAVG